MTENVRKRILSRSGKSPPSAVARGIASAAASDTMPRTPVKANAKGHCQDGAGSVRAMEGISHRGRYVAGNIQIKRAAITTAQTIAAEIIKLPTESSPLLMI